MRGRILLAAAVAAGAAAVLAQTNQPITPPSDSNYYAYGGYPGSYHSSTAGEGYAHGMADVVRSAGQANLNNSAAAINYSIAQRNEIDNRAAYTSTYFAMRDENRRARAAERRPRATMEELVHYAQAGKPKPLSPSELDVITGAVHWPPALQVDSYAKQRGELERIFSTRAAKGALSLGDYQKARQVTTAMLDQLKSQIRDIPPEQYTLAKRFVESLAYQATRPLG